jgi:hypothetical protein
MTERFGTEDAPQYPGGAPPATAEDNFEEDVREIYIPPGYAGAPTQAALDPGRARTARGAELPKARRGRSGEAAKAVRRQEARDDGCSALTYEGRAAIEGYLEQTESILSRWRKRRSKKR